MGLSAVLFTTTYGWRHIGCFRDHPHRAIAGGIRFRGPVARCARFARAHHWRFFSVQYGGECFTGPISYTRHFGRYGRAHNCHHGTGGGTVTSHYTIVTLHTTDTLLTLRGKDSVATSSVILHPTGLLSTGPNYTPNTHMQLIEKEGKQMHGRKDTLRT